MNKFKKEKHMSADGMDGMGPKGLAIVVVIMIGLVYFLTGCGVAEDLGRNCGGTLQSGCHAVFGGERDNEQDKRFRTIEDSIRLLEQQNVWLISLINSNTTNEQLLQQVVNQNTTSILVLQSNHNITKIVDPCGDGAGYDEVFMRTSTGKLIASFSDNSSGLNTRFVELTPGGPYGTTDGTGCTFTVGSDMSVTPSVEY